MQLITSHFTDEDNIHETHLCHRGGRGWDVNSGFQIPESMKTQH